MARMYDPLTERLTAAGLTQIKIEHAKAGDHLLLALVSTRPRIADDGAAGFIDETIKVELERKIPDTIFIDWQTIIDSLTTGFITSTVSIHYAKMISERPFFEPETGRCIKVGYFQFKGQFL